MPTAHLNGIDLYYESHGNGPAILFAHGAGGNHLSWWQQIPYFSQQHHCIIFDHRAFGRSFDSSGDGRTAFARDALALLDHLEIERAFLVAQSMGGRTAAGMLLNAPGRIRALVLAGTLGGAVSDETRELQQAFAQTLPPGIRLIDRALGRRTEQQRPDLVFLYRAIARLNPPRPRDFLAPRPGYRGSVAQRYAESGVPILFLVGEDDRVVPPHIVEVAHRLVAGSRFRMIPEAGHSAYFEQPEHFNATVHAFFREAEQG
ncbi:MAG: alpha/beta fold hydrolase [Dehalococcoidia bacterium]